MVNGDGVGEFWLGFRLEVEEGDVFDWVFLGPT